MSGAGPNPDDDPSPGQALPGFAAAAPGPARPRGKVRVLALMGVVVMLLAAFWYWKPWARYSGPSPSPGQPWTNSLGMRFVPVPGTPVLFGVWDVRVRDFQIFVDGTEYDAKAGMYSLRRDGWKQRGDTWLSPGFEQGPTSPVVGVNWEDAKAFCAWLTKKERAEGRIGGNQSYRLPTDAEWSAAAGVATYPWGGAWPPPPGAGNYAGQEAADANWPTNFSGIEGYRDGYARTSPVGAFAANQHGLYDMSGNVWQWCEDWYGKEMNSTELRKQFPVLEDDGGGRTYHVLRGASWYNRIPASLSCSYHFYAPGTRITYVGFRVVLAVGGPAR